jgi:hypothetical protein
MHSLSFTEETFFSTNSDKEIGEYFVRKHLILMPKNQRFVHALILKEKKPG